ncbi:MAG: cytochrome c biogenesis protein CcsA [candidate division Zixibacteria bacterium]|nr:cytochrome c biogenesis protein CcsA [candidate division Zixibacteria bacterium]
MVRTLLQFGLFLLLAAVICFSFITPAPQQQIGEASRIFYYHIPMAWVTVLAYLINLIYSIRYLKTRAVLDDWRALWSAEIGTVFCLLATLSGAIFAKVTWGVYWNWSEPRMLSIFMLLLIYGAYLSLRAALANPERKGLLSAVYAIFAFPAVPFFVFVFPRITESLHPAESVLDKNLEMQMSGPVLWIFLLSLFCFTALFFWIFSLGNRLQRLRLAVNGGA